MLPAAEAAIFKLQIRQARFRRYSGGRSITFSYSLRRPVPPLENHPENATLAVLTIRGRTSGFTTTATVRMNEGILSAIDFDPLPWADGGGFEIQGDLSEEAKL